MSRPADVGLVEHGVGVIQGEEGETLLGSFVEHLKAEQVTRELASIYFTPSFRTSEGHNIGSEAPVEPLDAAEVKKTELNVSRKTAN